MDKRFSKKNSFAECMVGVVDDMKKEKDQDEKTILINNNRIVKKLVALYQGTRRCTMDQEDIRDLAGDIRECNDVVKQQNLIMNLIERIGYATIEYGEGIQRVKDAGKTDDLIY